MTHTTQAQTRCQGLCQTINQKALRTQQETSLYLSSAGIDVSKPNQFEMKIQGESLVLFQFIVSAADGSADYLYTDNAGNATSHSQLPKSIRDSINKTMRQARIN